MLDALPITVAQAIKLCNTLFSDIQFQIEGEVSGFSVSRGTFVYFDLKDENQEACLHCFMMAHHLSVPLEDGMRVVVAGKPSIHAKSGKFSITVQKVEPKGEGSVRRAFELLKKKLEEEGLFAQERKRPLPRFPERVGIVSSEGAAGYGDFMRIAEQRLKGVVFVLANAAVQGREAEAEICHAFDHLNSQYQLDAIVLIRGGGSLEDLQAFNSELVARAIARSKAPVVVGVGHERDVTIADFCADVRAATPSNAAQLLLPTTEEVVALVSSLVSDGQRTIERRIATAQERVTALVRGMYQKMLFLVQSQRQRTTALISTINAISPQETLKRGYTITRRADGSIVRNANVQSGEHLTTLLADGTIHSVTT